MLIFWLFGAVAVGAALVATLVSEVKRAVLALWVCGIGLGGMFLSLNAEYLAIVQWVISTLAAASFVFYSVLLGSKDGKQDWLRYGLAFALVTTLSLVIWVATRDFSPSLVWDKEEHGVARLGQVLTSKYLLPLEIVSLTLFLVIIGAGVITRPERRAGGKEAKAP